MEGFKKCLNGHFYKDALLKCPYCKEKGNSQSKPADATDSEDDEKTGVFSSGISEDDDSDKTQIVGGKKAAKSATSKAKATSIADKTHFEEEYEEETEGGNLVVKKEQRTNRRLVGWLATYSIDALGVDYKIYEGRNVIGRDADCNITVNDKTISGKHATILFRADKYKIKDELSAHGTFVNDADIEEEAVELHDGDIIQLGNTKFVFKTSLFMFKTSF